MTASQLVQITGYQHQEFITHGHYIITDYNFLSPTVQKPGKIAPKSPPFYPLSWLKKASNLPHFRFKTHQNRPKTRRKTPKSKPLTTVWEQSENITSKRAQRQACLISAERE